MLFHYFARTVFNFILFFFWGRKTITGTENIPKSGSFLLVTNHMSVADAPLIFISLPHHIRIRYLIGEKWQHVPIIKYVAPKLGGIYINRDQIDRRAIKEATQILQSGGVMGMAPEGGRSMIGRMVKPRNGAAYLASRANVPILPVSVVNSEKLFGNWLKWRRTHCEVRFGEPFMLPTFDRRPRQKELAAYADYIMLRIARRLPERYYGYYDYIDHPGLAATLRGEDPWPQCLEKHNLSQPEDM